jgi:RNA polymerase sigma-70 factor (ECF subfamily)
MDPPEDQVARTQFLLNQAAKGDELAYDDLLAHAADRLVRLARRMLRRYPNLRRWEQTDDVFQNAAVRLHGSLRKVKPDSVRNFYGLATLEIRRTLIDLCRRHFGPEGAAGKYESDLKGDEDHGILQNEPDRHDPGSLELWSQFHEAVDKLPDEEREVTHLVWYGGMKQAEVATVLGVSVPTIKRRWYRARLLLYTLMDGQVPPIGERKWHA